MAKLFDAILFFALCLRKKIPVQAERVSCKSEAFSGQETFFLEGTFEKWVA